MLVGRSIIMLMVVASLFVGMGIVLRLFGCPGRGHFRLTVTGFFGVLTEERLGFLAGIAGIMLMILAIIPGVLVVGLAVMGMSLVGCLAGVTGTQQQSGAEQNK